MSLAGRQINPIDINFHLKKNWKFLIKNQLTKSDPKGQGVESAHIRVKQV